MDIENTPYTNGQDQQNTPSNPGFYTHFDDIPDLNLTPTDEEKAGLEKLEGQLKIYFNLCKHGNSLINNIEQKKDYHNPDQLTELMNQFQITQNGTNFPPSIVDPLQALKAMEELKKQRNNRRPPPSAIGENHRSGYANASQVTRSLWDSHKKTGATTKDIFASYTKGRK